MGQPDKRELIIQTAIALFGEKGYDATTVEEIAQNAGIAKGSFYLHYPSKDSIYKEVIQRAADARHHFLHPKAEDPSEDVRRALARLLTQELRFARAEKRFYRLLISEDRDNDPVIGQEIRNLRRSFLVELIELIRRGMLRGVIREGNAILLAQLLKGMVRGAYQMLEENSSLTVDQIVLSILDLLWRGWATS